MPPLVGRVLSTGRATLHELGTVYGTQDCYDILEVAAIDAHNAKLVREHWAREHK